MIRWLARWGSHKKNPHNIGRRGEKLAGKYLKRHGYRILTRNLRNRFGELDLIAQPHNDPTTIVFIEVKSSLLGKLPPEVHVTRDKQRRIITLSAQFLRRHHLEQKRARYDIIAVEFPPASKPILRHHIAAFESHV